MDIELVELEEIKNKIEQLEKIYQVEVLKLLVENECKVNENKSGVFVNLSYISPDMIVKIKEYLNYVSEQTETFKTMEYQKDDYKQNYFDKQDKDDDTIIYRSLTNANVL